MIAGEETLTSENRDAEEVYLGLRTRRGLAIGVDQLPDVQSWVESGWAVVKKGVGSPWLRLTPTGWLRLDSLAVDLASRRARLANTALGATSSHCYI